MSMKPDCGNGSSDRRFFFSEGQEVWHLGRECFVVIAYAGPPAWFGWYVADVGDGELEAVHEVELAESPLVRNVERIGCSKRCDGEWCICALLGLPVN